MTAEHCHIAIALLHMVGYLMLLSLAFMEMVVLWSYPTHTEYGHNHGKPWLMIMAHALAYTGLAFAAAIEIAIVTILANH